MNTDLRSAHTAKLQETWSSLEGRLRRLKQENENLAGLNENLGVNETNLHSSYVWMLVEGIGPLDAEVENADTIARAVLQTKGEFDQFFETFQANLFTDWMLDLLRFDRLFAIEQQHPHLKDTGSMIAFNDFYACLQNVFTCLSATTSIIQEIGHTFSRIIGVSQDAIRVIQPLGLVELSTTDITTSIISAKQAVDKCQEGLILEHSLLIEGKFLSVLKLEKVAEAKKIRRNEATTRTNLSVKLLKLAPTNFQQDMKVELLLISENTAQRIRNHGLHPGYIMNSRIAALDPATSAIRERPICSTMTASAETPSAFSSEIKHISVIDPERERGSNSRDVTRQKMCFLLIADVPFVRCTDNPDQITLLRTWKLSEPLIVISSSSHIPRAHATLLRDSHFSRLARTPFDVERTAKLPLVLDMLTIYFSELTRVPDKPDLTLEREGNHGNIQTVCLADMIVEHLLANQKCDEIFWDPNISRDELEVDLETLFFTHLSDRDFTFWTWFCKALPILRIPYFRELWVAGYILGFVTKPRAEALFRENGFRVGDFLIRYSESVEAALSVTFVGSDRRGNVDVMVYPLTLHWSDREEDLKRQFLTDLYIEGHPGLRNVEQFRNVYPNIEKRTAFPTLGEDPFFHNIVGNNNNNNRYRYVQGRRFLNVPENGQD